jgi:hypothetical protein
MKRSVDQKEHGQNPPETPPYTHNHIRSREREGRAIRVPYLSLALTLICLASCGVKDTRWILVLVGGRASFFLLFFYICLGFVFYLERCDGEDYPKLE